MSKKTKAVLFIVAELLLAAGIFIFWQTSEADGVSVAWQKILPWFAGLCLVLCVGGLFWFNGARKKW